MSSLIESLVGGCGKETESERWNVVNVVLGEEFLGKRLKQSDYAERYEKKFLLLCSPDLI